MSTFKELAEEFLAQKNIAVAGVSRQENATANTIYKTLRDKGYRVYPVNPQAESIEGEPCYPSVKDIPVQLDGVFIMTKPAISQQVVQDCVDARVPRVWMHENALAGSANTSVSQEAVKMCDENGIQVIAGGCPMMFLEFGHKCMRWILGVMGKLPD